MDRSLHKAMVWAHSIPIGTLVGLIGASHLVRRDAGRLVKKPRKTSKEWDRGKPGLRWENHVRMGIRRSGEDKNAGSGL